MSLEFANRICPNCKNPNYMVYLGDFSKAYKYKCINCNEYFNDIDFEKEPLQPVWKSEYMNTKVDDEVSLLKEQEAVRPVKQIEQTEWTVCGNCRNHIISKWIFCPYCGKPILWEGR